MWKKLGVALVALVSTFSVVYAMNNEMSANVATYGSTSAISGTIVPSTRDGKTSAASKSKIYYGSMSPATAYQNGPIPWEFIMKQDDGGYLLQVYGILDTAVPLPGGDASSAVKDKDGVLTISYETTNTHIITKGVNTTLTSLEKSLTTSMSNAEGETNIFVPTLEQYKDGGSLNPKLNNAYRYTGIYKDSTEYIPHPTTYYLANFYWSVADTKKYITCHAVMGHSGVKGVTSSGFGGFNAGTQAAGIRPVTLLKPDQMVFALQPLTSTAETGITTIDQNSGETMKMRALDTAITIKMATTEDIGDIAKGSVMEVEYENATVGSDKSISALITDKDGNLVYYKNLGPAKSGKNKLEIDTTGMTKNIQDDYYNIQLVNETITNDNRPTTSSALTDKVKFVVVEPHTLTYTAAPQTQDIYEYDKNVDEGTKIGTIARSDGAVPIKYEIVGDGDDSYKNFEIAGLDENKKSEATSLDVKVKATDAPNVNTTTKSLQAGTYKFCVESTDKNGYPTEQVVDKTKVCTSFVVYPSDSQLVYEQLKNPTTTAFYTKEELNALSSGTTLASSTFSDNANIGLLQTAGYNIKEVKLVKPDTTTLLTELEAGAVVGNSNKFEIKKKSGVTFTSDITFDILVVFEKDGVEVATIKKSNQLFKIPTGIKFVSPEEAKFLDKNEYTYTWNPNTTNLNQFILVATDKTTATMLNADMNYCVLDESKKCVTSSTVVELLTGGSVGAQKIQVKAPSTTDKKVKVRAYVNDADGNMEIFSDIDIIIHPAKQVLTWEGTNIQEKDNHITKDNAKHNTWKLSLKYDKDTAANNVHTSSEIIKGVTLVDKVITLRDEVVSGVTPTIEYDITYSDGADNGKVSIKDNKLSITGELKGDVKITASAAAVDNYHESKGDDSTTTNVNEDERAVLVVSVSDKAKVVFTPSYENSFNTKSNYANGTAGLGVVSINPTTETGYTYAIDSVKQLNTDTNEYDVIDVSKFTIKSEGSPASNNLYAKANSTLSAGTYKVTIKASKGNETATAKEVTIIVTPTSIDTSKIKWTQKDKISDTYGDVDGEIDKDTKTNTEILSKKYQSTDGVDGTFYANIANKEDTLLTDATIKYSLSLDSTKGIIEVAQDGKVTMKSASKSDSSLFIIATISKDGYEDTEVKLPITIEKGEITDFKFTKKSGTAYELDGDKKDITKYATQTFTYAQGDAGLLDIFTKGVPTGSDVTIKITSNGASKGNDVLKFNDDDASKNEDSDNPKVCVINKDDYATNRTDKCQAIIENALANQTSDKGKIILSASIDESDNYKAMSISMKINISQASNSDFGYVEDEFEVVSNTNGAIQPIFQDKDVAHPNIGTGKTMLLLEKSGEDSGFTMGEVELNADEYDPDNNPDNPYYMGYASYTYDITVDKDAPDSRTIYLFAQKLADRNYAASDVKKLTIHVLPEGQSNVITTVTSYPPGNSKGVSNITYGDDYFKLKTVSPDDESDSAATYTYEIEEASKAYMESYGSNANEFKPLKAGTSVKVKITRTSGTGAITNFNQTLIIQPKPVKLKIENISKKAGMSVSNAEYKFTSDNNDFLTSDKDKINITFNSLSTDGIDVSTLIDGVRIQHNGLPITVSIEDKDKAIPVLSNYKIVNMDGKTLGVENGILTVAETESNASWYEVKEGSKVDELGKTVPTIKGQNDWYNGPVNIVLKTPTGSYDQIAPEDKADKWSSDKFTVTSEGNTTQNIYFRMSSGTDKGSITKPQEEIIKIDTVAPDITEIKATLTHTDAFSKLIHAITFGTFMKPGEEITIHTKDVQDNNEVEVSTTYNVKDGITYNVYTLDTKGVRGAQIITNKKLDTNDEGVGTIALEEPGVYEVCAIVKDQASNSSTEKCEKLLVKKIDVDVDKDGNLDFNDPDGDGCPDLNIVWKNSNNTWTKLNQSKKDEKLPYINIDSEGDTAGSPPDGKADINIDTDDDKIADLNVVTIKTWNPTTCVTNQIEEYCTDNSLIPDRNIDLNNDGRPDINVDLDNDGIPDIEIDTDGDGEADINIDTDDDGTADEKLKVMKEWIIDEKVFEVTKKKFHTMTGLVEDNIDHLEDGGVVAKPGEGQTFLPNYALKVTDKTQELDEETKNNIKGILPDKAFKQYLKIDLTKDNVVIQPDGKVSISIPIDQAIKNPKVMIEQADGTFVEATGTLEDGVFTYETTFVGGVVVFGDNNIEEEPKQPDPVSPDLPTQNKPDTSVKGNYVGGMGGAGTGDVTNYGMLMIGLILSVTTLFFLTYKLRKEE